MTSPRPVPAGTEGPVRRTVLPGGLQVISERMPTVRSVTFGVWVLVGSRDESPGLAGASHYLEHLLFKGTHRRDAMAISAELEAVGGELNAFTTKEYTCYYARVRDADLPLAVDVVMDMVTDSLIRSGDVSAERGVILEEIAMHEDEPAEAVHDLFAAAAHGSTPLGRPVLGSVETVQQLDRRSLAGYYRRRYRPDRMVVAAAGNLTHPRLTRLIRDACRRTGVDGDADRPPAAVRRDRGPPAFRPEVRVLHRPTEQANLVLGRPGLSRTDPRRFALAVLNAVLGGGMSSRLFQEIRERRGLAYSVYSWSAHYSDTGLFGVYAGCQPAKAAEVLDLCRAELARVARSGVGGEELARAKGQLCGGLVLGLEDTSSRMSRLAKGLLLYDELPSVGELLARLAEVAADDVAAVAADLLDGPPALAVIGPFAAEEFAA